MDRALTSWKLAPLASASACNEGVRTLTLRSARTTDADALADVFRTHHAEVVRLAYLLCGDRERAEDLVAEVFTKLYRRLQRGPVDNVRAYLRRSVVNQVNSSFRRLALERREAARRRGDDRGARAHADDVAERAAMLAALDRLPPRQRTAVVLRFYEDLSEKEAAAVMGCSTGTVKSSLSRGLAKLRGLVSEEVG
jgi:RNA polymerase sigma-70 factor (sigma-E family)